MAKGVLTCRFGLPMPIECVFNPLLQMLSMNEAVSLFFTNPAFAVFLDWMINGKKVGDAEGVPLDVLVLPSSQPPQAVLQLAGVGE